MAHRTDTGLYFDAEARAMERRDKELIPLRLVIAMFSLALASVLLASFAVLTDRPRVGTPADAPIVSERAVVIEGDGRSIVVTDAATDEVVLSLSNGGFISVVNDGLERARLVARTAGNPPVQLTLFETGRLSLADPASGWSTELSSFGDANTRVWLNVLNKK